MKTIYIGIDPGASGGMAAIMPDGTAVAEKWTDETEILDELNVIARNGERIQAAIEHVHAGIFAGKDGRMGAKSAFSFGRNVGIWHGILLANGIPFRTVLPREWQKGIAGVNGRNGADLKRHWKAEACRRFPDTRPTLATCDALLIADWARREGL